MRQDEPTRPVRVPRLRSMEDTQRSAEPTLPRDDEHELRARLCVDRETERIPKHDAAE